MHMNQVGRYEVRHSGERERERERMVSYELKPYGYKSRVKKNDAFDKSIHSKLRMKYYT